MKNSANLTEKETLIEILKGIKESLDKNLEKISEKLGKIENELSALSRATH